MDGLRLRLGLGLLSVIVAAVAVRFGGGACPVALERAAQEAVDQRGRLLRASGKDFANASRAAIGAFLVLPLALFPLGFAQIPIARILLPGPVVTILVAGAAKLVTILFQPVERL